MRWFGKGGDGPKNPDNLEKNDGVKIRNQILQTPTPEDKNKLNKQFKERYKIPPSNINKTSDIRKKNNDNDSAINPIERDLAVDLANEEKAKQKLNTNINKKIDDRSR